MAWDDFCKYFGELTICRLLPDRVEARQVIGQCTVVPQGSPRKEGAPLPSPPRTEELAVVSPVTKIIMD